jgi:hypothetical protein
VAPGCYIVSVRAGLDRYVQSVPIVRGN